MKTLIYITMLGMYCFLTNSALSQIVSENQLRDKISYWNESKSDIVKLQSVDQIQNVLDKLDDADRAVLSHLWLTKLSELEQVNAGQKHWLDNMLKSDLTLSGYLDDHPEKLLDLITISRSAKSTIRLLNVKHLATVLSQQWQKDAVEWTNWLEPQTSNYAALIHWLKTTSPEQAKRVSAQWLNADLLPSLPDNHALTVLLTKNYSLELVGYLVQRRADEFTYQYYQQLPQTSDSFSAIAQLDLALGNSDLASQAILALATHYSHELSAQTLIKNALHKPSTQWFAITALEKVKDEEFRTALLKRYDSDASSLAKAAKKQLKKGESL